MMRCTRRRVRTEPDDEGRVVVATGNITNTALLSLFEAHLDVIVGALDEADFVEFGPDSWSCTGAARTARLADLWATVLATNWRASMPVMPGSAPAEPCRLPGRRACRRRNRDCGSNAHHVADLGFAGDQGCRLRWGGPVNRLASLAHCCVRTVSAGGPEPGPTRHQ